MNSDPIHLPGNATQSGNKQDVVDSSATGYSDALILIYPITTLADNITEQVKQVSNITGLDSYTIRQKLTGSVLDVLCAGNDIPHLKDIASRLSTAGYQTAFVRKSELTGSNKYQRAITAKLSSDGAEAIAFLDINGNELFTCNQSSQLLIIAGSLEPEQYGSSKTLLASLYGNTSQTTNSKLDRINEISKQKPGLMLINELYPAPVFIDAAMFNYDFLKDKLSLSLAQNYISLVTLLGGFNDTGNTVINTGFGQKTLPLGVLASKPKTKPDIQNVFALYAKLATLAHKQGFFAVKSPFPVDKSQQTPSNPILEVATTLTQAGVLGSRLQPNANTNPSFVQAQNQPKTKHTSSATTKSSQLPPPPNREESSYDAIGLNNLLMRIQRFGPPAFVLGCVVLSALLMALSMPQSATLSKYWSFLPIGLALCNASVIFARRKGAISGLPTSRIRSMPMGLVEVKGQAKCKYALKAPHSLVDCIYYNFRVLERTTQTITSGAETETWRVINRGDSGRIPFYIEDSTGRALIDPTGATMAGAQTNEYSASFAEMVSGMVSKPNRKIIETVIPEGAKLYILGHAHPTAKAPAEQRKEYRQRLKALKADPELIRSYDTDGDGSISFEEWAVAKANLDSQILQERIESDPLEDNVVIGQHSDGGIFYISDKVESDILSSYSWKIPALGLTGFALLVKGLWEVLGK